MTEETPTPYEGEDSQPEALSQGGACYHAEIDPAYAPHALEKMRNIVTGNGIKPDHVTLENFEGETLEFICVTKLTLKVKISEKRQAGKITGPQIVDNAAIMREAIEKEKSKILHRPDVIKRIKDVLLQRPDKGFGLHNELIKLPFLHKQFAHYEACNTCNARGSVPCQRCHGQGYEMCTHCRGTSFETCVQCRGHQYIAGPQGARQACPRCRGQGKTPCSACKQTRKIPCSVCKTKKTTLCKNCNGHAWNSHIAIVEIDVIGLFDYDRSSLEERIVSVIEQLGSEFVEHVHVKPIDAPFNNEQKNEDIYLPYVVHLPNGDATFTMKDRKIESFIFGTQHLFIDTPFFLEDIMTPGIQALQTAGTGQGAVAAALQKAGRFKTLRHIIIAAGKFKQARAITAVLKATPAGISEETLKTLLLDADKALRALSRRPRQIALLLGLLTSAGIYEAYFRILRPEITKDIPSGNIHIGIDLGLLIAGIGLTLFIIQCFGNAALRKALKNIVPAGKENKKLARTGKQGLWAVLGGLLIYLVVLESLVPLGGNIPEWYNALRGLLPF